jgi:hypothetical protein
VSEIVTDVEVRERQRETLLEQRLGLVADIAFYLVALYFFFYLSR